MFIPTTFTARCICRFHTLMACIDYVYSILRYTTRKKFYTSNGNNDIEVRGSFLFFYNTLFARTFALQKKNAEDKSY